MRTFGRRYWGFSAAGRDGWRGRSPDSWVDCGVLEADLLDGGVSIEAEYAVVVDLDGLFEPTHFYNLYKVALIDGLGE